MLVGTYCFFAFFKCFNASVGVLLLRDYAPFVLLFYLLLVLFSFVLVGNFVLFTAAGATTS